MPRGGARSGSGPAPDPNSLRTAVQLERGAIRTLPRVRTGGAPAFPLPKPTARERAVWVRLWKRPEAIVWAEEGRELEVGFYVRAFVEAEEPGAVAAKRNGVLQLQNSLLLTHDALAKAGYRISTGATASAAATGTAGAAPRSAVPSSRGRLRAVEDVGPGS